VGRRMLLPWTNDDIENHPQVTHKVSVQGVAGTARLVRVVTYLRAALLAEQGFDGGVDVQNPARVQGRLHAGQQLRPQPVPALVRAHPRQRPAQSVLADDLAHAENLRADPVPAQCGDMSIAMLPRQDRQQPGPQNIPLMGGVATAVKQRATCHPRLVHPGRGKKLSEKGKLRVRGGAGFHIPANLNATSRRLHRERLQPRTIDGNPCPRRLTHRVTPP
jgi:hypothetical protein